MPELGLSEQIKKANRLLYNEKSPESYNRNESIFNDHRRMMLTARIREFAAKAGKERCLDIGTGTGNMMRILLNVFDSCYGVDIGEKLLVKISKDFPDCFFSGADAENLPFKNESFNCVTSYAVLHHLFSHGKICEEAFRVLKPGGIFFTDHDPNYFLNRFYRLFYVLRHWNKPGFGSEIEELAEYHNSMSPGINPEKLKELLISTGFSSVIVNYRISDRPHWPFLMRMTISLLKFMSRIIPLKSFFTHFSIIAIK